MPMVQGLNRLLQADGDQQTNRNREQVKEKVASSMNSVLGWMNVNHWLLQFQRLVRSC
jgi:hypothetical protein